MTKRIKRLIIDIEYEDVPELVPVFPAPSYPTIPFEPWTPQLQKSSCPKCGLVLEQVMMYCCPDIRCPVGLGSPSCYYSPSYVSCSVNT